MPSCSYCDETFADDEALLAHLDETHEGELSAIDRRRVASARTDDGGSRLVLYGAIAAVVVLLLAGVYVTTIGGGEAPLEAQPLPDRGDDARLSAVEEFPSEGAAHVAPGTELEYDTTPPTSGPHYPDWTDPGFYETEQPAGQLVHALEHGNVVIYYDPAALSPEAAESLRAFAETHTDTFAAVIVVPNPAGDPAAPYVLTAWQTRLVMEDYDAGTVRAFLAEYLGRGPENPVR